MASKKSGNASNDSKARGQVSKGAIAKSTTGRYLTHGKATKLGETTKELTIRAFQMAYESHHRKQQG
jgi:hypothetical protein